MGSSGTTCSAPKRARPSPRHWDQSILSVGSQSELRIVKHDPRSQQTTLELNYGRVRAEVAPVTRRDGQFQVKTPTAVAGVTAPTSALSPASRAPSLSVSPERLPSAAPIRTYLGAVTCKAGQTVTVARGQAPGPPQSATADQLNDVIRQHPAGQYRCMAPLLASAGLTPDYRW